MEAENNYGSWNRNDDKLDLHEDIRTVIRDKMRVRKLYLITERLLKYSRNPNETYFPKKYLSENNSTSKIQRTKCHILNSTENNLASNGQKKYIINEKIIFDSYNRNDDKFDAHEGDRTILGEEVRACKPRYITKKLFKHS
jgi:hypothetical protein